MTPKATSLPILVVSIVYAAIIIGTAFMFRHSPSKVWIESTIAVGGIAVWLCLVERYERRCARSNSSSF